MQAGGPEEGTVHVHPFSLTCTLSPWYKFNVQRPALHLLTVIPQHLFTASPLLSMHTPLLWSSGLNALG